MSQSSANSTNLVGRTEQCAALVSLLCRGARSGAALAISGPGGIGKSVLLEASIRAAVSSGHVVLSGSASPLETAIAFATLNHVLTPVHDAVTALDRHRVLVTGVLGHGPPSDAEPAQVAEAVVDALASTYADSPVLIAVDDAQWADPASAAVLSEMARSAIGRRFTVLIAHRSDEPMMLGLAGFETVPVPPLDRHAASTLLSERNPELAPWTRERVLTEAGGNPLALIDLPAALTGRQRRGEEQLPAELPLTRRLRSLFTSRFLSLDVQLQQLLLLAALGDEFGPRAVFSHPLVRLTILELATPVDRRRAHSALAQAHARRPERRAYHLGEATVEPDEAVAELLERGAFSSLHRGDAVSGVNALVRAAQLSPVAADRKRRLAHAAYLATDVTGDLDLASTLLAGVRASRSPEATTVGETVAAAHLSLVRDGDAETAHRLLVASVRAWSPTDGADRRPLVTALSSLFEVCVYSARPQWWIPLRAAVAEHGDIIGPDLRLLVAVLGDPARVTPAVLAELDAAIARLDSGSENDPIVIRRTATAALFVDRASGCTPALRTLADKCESDGAVTMAVNAAMVLWAEEFHRGRWDTSATVLDSALTLCARRGLSLFAMPLRYGQATLAAVRGDDDSTQRLAAEINAWAAPRGIRGLQLLAWHARALSAIGRGDFDEAHRLLELVSPTDAVPDDPPLALWSVYDVVEAAVRSGHRGEAVAYVENLDALGVAGISARLAMVVGGAAALVAPASKAGARFEAALAIPGGSDWPFAYARVRLAYGEHLRRQRKITAARAVLGIALQELQSLSAWPWAARAAVEIRAAQAPGDGWNRLLTPQQQQTAALAGAGLTNNQIAQRLQLSPRTVAAHLRQVFPKLGVAGRRALHGAMPEPDHLPSPLFES